MLTHPLVLQPFTGDDTSRQESQSPQEYSHAQEHCGRAGVTLPLVGLVVITTLVLVLLLLLTVLFLSVQGTLSKSEWEATSEFLHLEFISPPIGGSRPVFTEGTSLVYTSQCLVLVFVLFFYGVLRKKLF